MEQLYKWRKKTGEIGEAEAEEKQKQEQQKTRRNNHREKGDRKRKKKEKQKGEKAGKGLKKTNTTLHPMIHVELVTSLKAYCRLDGLNAGNRGEVTQWLPIDDIYRLGIWCITVLLIKVIAEEGPKSMPIPDCL